MKELKQGEIIMLDGQRYIVNGEQLVDINKMHVIKRGEKYWTVLRNGLLEQHTNDGTELDRQFAQYAYVTRTFDEAKIYKEYLELRNKYEQYCSLYPCDWSSASYKHYLYYNSSDKKIAIGSTQAMRCNDIYCSNKRHLEKFIAIHDEKEIKLILGIGVPDRYWMEES